MEKQRLLFEAVFRRLPSDSETGRWLAQVAANHPYFSIAQFFHLQHTKPGTDEYNRQASKTALFFNNPGWLQYQLLKGQAANSVTEAGSDSSSIPEASTPAATTQVGIIDQSPTIEKDDTEAAHNEGKMSPIPGPAPVAVNDDILFEPLHTTDYFASVGIKLSEQEKTNDRLGKQLKSFTEWLKMMKKTGANNVTSAANEKPSTETQAAEHQIKQLAEQSNEGKEVLTESMAEVLIQQGRKEKAIKILEKLSLLDPAKSHYFAAKIHQLKGN